MKTVPAKPSAPAKSNAMPGAIKDAIAQLQQLVRDGSVDDNAHVEIKIMQKGGQPVDLDEVPEDGIAIDDLDLMEPVDAESNPLLAHVLSKATPVKTMSPRYRISNEPNGKNERIEPTSKFARKK